MMANPVEPWDCEADEPEDLNQGVLESLGM